MNAFIWNKLFETGIASVDEQHQRLVDIINRLGVALISRNESSEVTDAVYAELSDYALHHFADEEQLMVSVGLDPAHVQRHRLHHQQFVEQLGALWAGRSQLSQPVDALLGFLCSWLTFHILEEDQRMARQIERVRRGMGAAEALSCEDVRVDVGSAALLAAMHELYRVLAQQNAALADANAQLEEKVSVRTRELIQSVKMAAIGQLAAGVAHEINNPIGFVNSNLNTLRRYAAQLLEVIDACGDCAAADAALASKFAAISNQVKLPHLRDDLPALLDETRDGLDRVKRIVQALQDYAHTDSGEKHATDLLAGLRNTLGIAENQIAQRAEIRCELTPVPAVRCSPGLINQVFMNLLVNAAQSMVQRGVITLRSGFDATGVWIEVNDTGCGIGADQMSHLFEPFYTTKPVGQGTGLGLSTSWDIVVKQHGGRIDVQSAPNQGSSFTVWLPRNADGAAA